MAHYTTIMNELLNLIPRHRFETIVNNFAGNRYVKRFYLIIRQSENPQHHL